MSRNSAIKHYDTTPEGQPMELLGSTHARRPIVLELLRSPWIMRASELGSRDGAWSTKHAAEPVDVAWDANLSRPVSFVRNGRVWSIDAVIQMWSVERSWWDRRRQVSRHMWRVVARGGVYDLAFDRLENTWLLLGIQD